MSTLAPNCQVLLRRYVGSAPPTLPSCLRDLSLGLGSRPVVCCPARALSKFPLSRGSTLFFCIYQSKNKISGEARREGAWGGLWDSHSAWLPFPDKAKCPLSSAFFHEEVSRRGLSPLTSHPRSSWWPLPASDYCYFPLSLLSWREAEAGQLLVQAWALCGQADGEHLPPPTPPPSSPFSSRRRREGAKQ